MCLKPFRFAGYHIIAQEFEKDGSVVVANCVMAAPMANSAMLRDCYESAEQAFRIKQKFGELGPAFLAKFAEKYRSHVQMKPPSVFCPAPYTKWADAISGDLDRQAFIANYLRQETMSVHLWNEMWRLAGINKNTKFSTASFFESECKKFGI